MTANSKVSTWMAVGRRLVKLTQQPFLHQQLAITYQLQLLQLVNSNPTHGNCVWVLLICIVAHELKPSTTRWHCTSSNFLFMWVSFFLLSELHWFWINKNLYVSTAVFVHIMDRQLRNTLSISCFEILQTESFCALYVYIIIRYPTPMTVLYVTKIAVNYAIDVIVCQQMSAHYTSYFLLTTYGKLSWTDYFNSQFTIS